MAELASAALGDPVDPVLDRDVAVGLVVDFAACRSVDLVKAVV